MTEDSAHFAVGQLIHHKIFDYRGVVVDVDARFTGTGDWYKKMARSQPPKDRPWYHVLVDGATHRTYVAERNLEPDTEGSPIRHPDIQDFFRGMHDGRYLPRRKAN